MTDTLPPVTEVDSDRADGPELRYSLDANIIIANAPDPVFVSDLGGLGTPNYAIR